MTRYIGFHNALFSLISDSFFSSQHGMGQFPHQWRGCLYPKPFESAIISIVPKMATKNPCDIDSNDLQDPKIPHKILGGPPPFPLGGVCIYILGSSK